MYFTLIFGYTYDYVIEIKHNIFQINNHWSSKMSDFNRYTTAKGQMLLNIQPPSQTNNTNPSNKIPTTSNISVTQSRYIPVNTTNTATGAQTYTYQAQPQPSTIPLQPGQPRVYTSQNSRIQTQNQGILIPNRNIPNSNIYLQNNINQPSSRIAVKQPNTFYSIVEPTIIPNYERPVVNQPPLQNTATFTYNQNNQTPIYTQRPFASPSGHYYGNQQLGDDKSQRQYKGANRPQTQQQYTKCCFPAFWFLMLLMAVVLGSFFLILFRNTTERSQQTTNITDITNNTNSNGTILTPNNTNNGENGEVPDTNPSTSYQLPPNSTQTSSTNDTSSQSPIQNDLILDYFSKVGPNLQPNNKQSSSSQNSSSNTPSSSSISGPQAVPPVQIPISVAPTVSTPIFYQPTSPSSSAYQLPPSSSSFQPQQSSALTTSFMLPPLSNPVHTRHRLDLSHKTNSLPKTHSFNSNYHLRPTIQY